MIWFHRFSNIIKIKCCECSYIQIGALNRIEILNITMYSLKPNIPNYIVEYMTSFSFSPTISRSTNHKVCLFVMW